VERVGLAILALDALIGTSNAMACVIPPQPVLDSDLRNVPDGLIAARAEIVAITWHGPDRGIPNSGFTLKLHTRMALAGNPGETLIVDYGPCNIVPGKVGQTVPVLAKQLADGTFRAPQFPPRMWPAATRSDAN
jgi:hypothetical protein